jgi:hypothetical protein
LSLPSWPSAINPAVTNAIVITITVGIKAFFISVPPQGRRTAAMIQELQSQENYRTIKK